MEQFFNKNRGPIIVGGILVILILAFLLISAIVNMPAHRDSFGGLGWLLIIGATSYGAHRFTCFMRFTRFTFDETRETVIDGYAREVVSLDETHETGEARETVNETTISDETLIKLFGTNDISLISSGIEAMYSELSRLRSFVKQDVHNETVMKRLKRERDEAMQQISVISQKLSVAERQVIQPVKSRDLIEFFESITIKDGEQEDAILKSKRRQRRFTQRLRAEGYCIAIAPPHPSPHA